MSKREFDRHNVEYKEINIDEHPEIIEELKSRGFNAAPVIGYNDEEFIVGFQPSKIKILCEKVGAI
jgi:glutaredoxin